MARTVRTRFRSWRTRLLLAFLGLLVPVVALGTYDVQQEFERQQTEVLEAQVATAQALATGLEAIMNDLRHNLALVAHQFERERPIGQRAVATLAGVRPLVWPADVLILLDADGVGVAAEPDEGRVGMPAADRPHQRRVLRGEQDWALSPLIVGARSGRLGVAMIHVIRDARGGVAGAIVAWLDASTVGEALKPTRLAPGTVFAIIDGEGQAVYHSRYPDLPLASRDWSASPDVEAALAGEVTRVKTLESTSDGVIRMGATVPVPSLGWAVGVFRPRPEALAPAYASMRRQVVQLGALVVCLGAAAWVLSARIARPVRALEAGAEALGAGRLDVRVPEEDPDEIGRLGRAFNVMATRLGEQMRALSTANAALAAVLESVPEGIVLAEPSGRIALANPASRAILGCEPSATDLSIGRALAGETFTAAEARVVAAWGERVLRVAGAPIFDAGGGIAGAAIAFHDITERKRVEAERSELLGRERALRAEAEAAERRAAFLAEASTLLASSLDYEATLASVARLAVPRLADWCLVDVVGEDGRLEPLAIAHADPSKAALARELDRRYPPAGDAPAGPAHVFRTGRSELVAEVPEVLLVRLARDTEHLHVLRELRLTSYVCVPLAARGRMLGTLLFASAESGRRYGPADLAFAEDLARRAALSIDNARLYREAQSAAGEAQEAVRTRDAFLARASHELRTPLTSALGTIRILRKVLSGGAHESPDALLDIASRNLTTMAALINDLLDASKLAAGRELLDRQPVEVAAVVAASVEVVGAPARDKGVAVRVAVPEGLVLEADRLKLEQVLVNLLANAVKFTPAGGLVTVTAAPEGAAVRLVVQDTGEGIAAEHLERIFEPFFQAGPRSGRRPRGTGLGLAICRQIVTLHGGTIHAESRGPGTGSTFVVSLPMPPAESRAA